VTSGDLSALVLHVEDQADDALLQLHDTGIGLGMVMDDDEIAGTVRDGDIRRWFVGGGDPEEPVRTLLSPVPGIVAPDAPDDDVRRLLAELQVPAVIVVEAGEVVGVRSAADVGAPPPPTSAVILAGGRGQRLAPLTDKVPKPLLTVGRTTILERLLEGLRSSGVVDISLAVNYKAEMFEERLGDGSRHQVSLSYLRERKPLHTAGPLSLLPEPPPGPLLVMNADQVTALQFGRMVDYHRQAGAALTVAAFDHTVDIPYGVLRHDGGRLLGTDEKPTLRFPCNTGIYVLEPDVVDLVPRNTFFGMPDLMDAVLAEGRQVAVFPLVEQFIDIGTREELDKALVWFATGEEV
jgi:dTDP-glucose pyrophosphorylase